MIEMCRLTPEPCKDNMGKIDDELVYLKYFNTATSKSIQQFVAISWWDIYILKPKERFASKNWHNCQTLWNIFKNTFFSSLIFLQPLIKV